MAKTLTTPGGVHFVAGHPLLVDVARDLTRALGDYAGPPAFVHVGVHRNKPIERTDDTPHIGLQTEQIRDLDGSPMWKAPPQEVIAQIVERFDAVLDLSEANAPAYDFLPAAARRKVTFGPHIFPQRPPAFRLGGQGLVFVGNINGRRAGILEGISNKVAVTRVPGRTFGRMVDRSLVQGEGVLNIHFQDGVYTEYPRLLKAVLNGKPMFSELLAPPLVAGQHYFGLVDRPTQTEAAEVFRRATQLLCGDFSLARFLTKVLVPLSGEAMP